MKEGILVVSFGTTYGETREKNIEKLAETVRGAYPDCLVAQAYSSEIVRRVLKERDHITVPDVKEALHQMREEGIRSVTVLPTHIIDGIENHRMKEAVEACRGLFARVKVADALLTTDNDYKRVANALWNAIAHEAGDAPAIFMGHGSAHEADKSYGRLEAELNKYSANGIYIATVEGADDIDAVLVRLKNSGRKKGQVFLAPFMLVAGAHAVHDMAGEENSFVFKLRAAGYQPKCRLEGIGSYPEIRDIYLEHLKRA